MCYGSVSRLDFGLVVCFAWLVSRFAFLAVVRLGGLFGGVESAGDGMNLLGLTDLPFSFFFYE